MNAISYEPNGSTPGIILDKETGKFQIVGESFPENAAEFYEPILNWFDEYILNPLQTTIFDFQLSYFNTISAKFFVHLMTKMENLTNIGLDAKIRWFYNEGDEDQEEAGEEFESIVDVNFELIPINNGLNAESDKFFDDMMDNLM